MGHFLNVHEGPQNIRVDLELTPLTPGMVTSNEPGLYRANQYGIQLRTLYAPFPIREASLATSWHSKHSTSATDNTLVEVALLTDRTRG